MKNTKFFIILLILFGIFFTCENPEEPDTTPPTVSIASHTSGQTVFEIETIQVSTNDNEGISKVEFYIDDSLMFSDTESPYQYNWNTTHYQNGSQHIVKVISFDTSDNSTESQPIMLIVDNTNSFPQPVNIITVSYNQSEMEITWGKSKDHDFFSYELLTSDNETGIKSLIESFYNIDDTLYVLTEFDLTTPLWLWVSVTDTFGYSTYGESYSVVEYPPTESEITSIIFLDNSFNISWDQNNDDDFESYNLYESDNEIMTGKNLIYFTNDRTDTNHLQLGINYDERKYYQLAVQDIYGIESSSHIKIGSSFIKIVYESNRFSDVLFLIDIDGKNKTQLTNSGNSRYPIFFPNGRKILFIEDENNDELYSVDIDGRNTIRLTNNTDRDREPDISPDGEKIVFQTNRDGNEEIYIMNSDGSNQINLTNHNGSDNGPKFSSSGAKIVFYSYRNGNTDVYLMNNDGSNQTRLTTEPQYDGQPSFSHDGSRIVFRSYRDNNYELYIMEVDGNNQIRLTNTSGEEKEPQFSPDGTKILYQYDETGNYKEDIYIMNVDGSNKLNLTNNPEDDRNPQFSSDGSIIVFQSEMSGGNSEIYKIDIDGNNLVNISNDPNFMEYSPSIQSRP
ncbi:MAG: PD40 domain-containing protein [Candidatus Marinimicrobia bacterium]|nr:PD40 domain-containing protein [Candidatus Neomarinimicrobiota bacterium]